MRPLPARVLAGLARHGVALVSYGWLARPGATARDAALLRLPIASVDQRAPEAWYTRDEAADLLARLEGMKR